MSCIFTKHMCLHVFFRFNRADFPGETYSNISIWLCSLYRVASSKLNRSGGLRGAILASRNSRPYYRRHPQHLQLHSAQFQLARRVLLLIVIYNYCHHESVCSLVCTGVNGWPLPAAVNRLNGRAPFAYSSLNHSLAAGSQMPTRTSLDSL